MAALSGHIGELAALGTASCWAGSALCFEASSRRIGSLSVNLIRLLIAFGLLTLINFLVRGQAIPDDVSGHAWLWLWLSGLVGFAFGDLCQFRAFVLLGSRRAVLIMSLAPGFTALFGWLGLGETLPALALFGMALTMCGVIIAVRERPAGSTPVSVRGVLLALGGTLGQAGGLVLSKYGMASYSPLAATQIRILAGIAGFALVFTCIRWWPRVWAARHERRGLAIVLLGSLLGPVCGVSLSLFAVQHTQAGIAASLMATTPILILPLGARIHRERITPRALVGAVVAFLGVILLFR